MRYFLGADLGATKTHTLIVDETGTALGFGESGPGNHETVNYDGMFEAMRDGMEQALNAAGLKKADITGAGFGVAGYDWSSEFDITAKTIDRLGLTSPYKFVNDSVAGLVAGAEEGWGVVVISGTGCNCRGWDREHNHEGRVTGHGVEMGEGAGGTELIFRCMQLVGYMPDIIDVNAGTIIDGEETIEEVGEHILELIIRVASGEQEVCAEKLGQDDFIPWKRGVSL